MIGFGFPGRLKTSLPFDHGLRGLNSKCTPARLKVGQTKMC